MTAQLIRNAGPGSKDAFAVVSRALFDEAGIDPERFPRHCELDGASVRVQISPSAFRYLQRIGESRRGSEVVSAIPYAEINGRPRLWTTDFALLHGARTRDNVLDWCARNGVRSQAKDPGGLEVPTSQGTGSVFFDGTDEEVQRHLEETLGTDAFRLLGTAVELELPLVGKDMRPRPTGETTRVRIAAPSAWGIQAPGRGQWWHVVAEGAQETLCTISLATWQSGAVRDDSHSVTCPWCRARMIAIHVAAPPAPGGDVRWASRCVYTMRHSDDLEAALAEGGTAEWVENRAWKSGKALVDGAAPEERVPIIFSAAERDSGLIFYGELQGVEIAETGTTYMVAGLQHLADVRPLSSLTVVSSGQPLPDSYIRPYAICWTPSFLPPARQRPEAAAEIDADYRPTLHVEIAAILRGAGNGWQTTQWLADEVNRRGRFRKRDASAVTAFQIHGRTRNYTGWFERDGSRVKLREDAPPA